MLEHKTSLNKFLKIISLNTSNFYPLEELERSKQIEGQKQTAVWRVQLSIIICLGPFYSRIT